MFVKHVTKVCSVGIFFSFYLLGGVHAEVGAGQEVPDPARLLPRLLEGWQQLKNWDETEKEYQVDAKIKSPRDKSPAEVLYQIRIKPLCWLCKFQQHTNNQVTGIYCQSPYYTFVIANKMAEEKNGWVLGSLDKIDSQSGFREAFFNKIKTDFFYPFTSFGSTLLHLIAKEGDFSVSGIRAGESGKLLVDFAYSVKGRQGELGKVTGRMVVDPGRYCVVLESRRTSTLTPGREFLVRRKLEESPEAPGGFRCKSYDFQAVNLSTKEVVQSIRHDYHSYSYRPVSDEVFRLSNYGLPEPPDVPSRPWSRIALWLLLVLATAAVMGVAVRLRKRARRV